MDPFTSVAILAAHLLCSAALFALIARRIPERREATDWALGAFSFGAAFVGRLALGLGAAGAAALASDVLMILAVLLFARGMSKLAGHDWGAGRVLAAALALGAAHVALAAAGGEMPRFVFLNALLGVLYLVLAGMSWQPLARRTCHERQRLPLGLCGVLVGGLGIATLARAAHIPLGGLASLYQGAGAAAYFALSSLVAVLLVFTMLWVIFERLNGDLADLASHDALTRVLNRNGMQAALQRHFAGRPAAPLTLLLVDIDHFKSVNDRHGHASGDRLLKAVAECLVQTCRASDFVARLGGEEFVVACAAGEAEFAEQLAERICTRVAALNVPLARGGTLGRTVSVGVSPPFASLAHWEAASQQADAALYRSKAAGRNRWTRFDPALQPSAVAGLAPSRSMA